MQNRFKKLLISSTLLACAGSLPASADTLQQIFDLAVTNDPQIRAAEASLKANQEQRNLGRAGILPSVSLSGSYSDSTFSPEDNSGDTDTESTSYSANLSQALFDLPAWYSYKSGDAAAEQAEQDYLSAKQDLIVRTVTAYFNVLSALDTMEATKAEEVALASQLEQTQQRYEVGLIAVTDVHEAQAAYDDVVARLVNALGNVGIAFENLTVLTNQSHTSIAPLKEDFPIANPSPETAEDWVELALTNSFDLKSATLSRDSADYNAQSKKWEHLPSLSLGLSYSDSDTEQTIGGMEQPTGARDGDTTSVSLSLNVPLYLGGSVSASRRQAYYQYVAAEENLNNTQRLLVQNTRNQHLTVQIDVAEANARRQAITSSQSAYEATRAGYDVGTRNLVDVLNAEQALYQARRNYATARYDYIIDLFTLNQLAGALTSSNISELNTWLDASTETPRSIVERSMPGMPAPASTSPAASTSSPAAAPASADAGSWTPEEMLQQWAADWSALNISGYLDHYSDNFEPRGQLTNEWRNERRDRLSRLSNVSVALSNVDVISQSERSATVLFDQSYSSSNYSDRSEKEIVLTKEDGRWKIASERALRIIYD